MPRQSVVLFLGLALSFSAAEWARAGDGNYKLSLEATGGAIGHTGTIDVRMDLDSEAVSAVGFTVCHEDGMSIGVGDIALGAALEDADFSYFLLTIEDGAWGVAFALDGALLPVGSRATLFTASYSLDELGVMDIAFCDTIVEPSVTNETGDVIEPVTESTSIEVLNGYTLRATDRVVEYDPADGAASFTIELSVQEQGTVVPTETAAVAFALRHDSAILDATAYRVVNELATVSFILSTGGFPASGFYFVAIFDPLTAPPETITFESEKFVLEVDYDVVPGALKGDIDGLTTEIVFPPEGVGHPPVINQIVALETSTALWIGNGVEIDNALIELVPIGGVASLFLRGDADSNGTVNAISDSIYLLRWQFVFGGDLPCADAADADGNNAVSALHDALSLLRWGYAGGAAPPAPGPDTCGEDDDLDAATTCEAPPASCL